MLCTVCVACTNSKLVLRPLYNSIDNRLEERFLDYADFDPGQIQRIQDLSDHFHVWHRQTQLSIYSELLDDIVERLKEPKRVELADVQRWSSAIRSFTADAGRCNPVYASADVIASLSDDQIVQIREKRAARFLDDDEDSDAEEDSEQFLADSMKDRVKRVKRYLGLIGINLTTAQVADLSETMRSTIRPETSFREMIEALDVEFYALLERREEAGFEAMFVTYLDRRRQSLADRRKDTRPYNRRVWEDYALRTIHSLNAEQRPVATQYLKGLASTISALAKDEPSFQKLSAAQYQCRGKRVGN